jgi:hypothetical protein
VYLTLSLLLLVTNPPARDELAGFVAGIERTPLVVNGTQHPRVEKEAGNVVWLQLDGMQLAPDDFRLLAQLKTLRRLSLVRTNTTDKDLAQLRELSGLEMIALTSTEVTDEAVETLTQLPALRTACLGNVKIAPTGIARLKAKFPKLSLGYSPRQ